MTPFIYPFQANYLRKKLNKLLHVVYFVGDYRVYKATRDALLVSISDLLGPLTPLQSALFDGIEDIKGQRNQTERLLSL